MFSELHPVEQFRGFIFLFIYQCLVSVVQSYVDYSTWTMPAIFQRAFFIQQTFLQMINQASQVFQGICKRIQGFQASYACISATFASKLINSLAKLPSKYGLRRVFIKSFYKKTFFQTKALTKCQSSNKSFTNQTFCQNSAQTVVVDLCIF